LYRLGQNFVGEIPGNRRAISAIFPTNDSYGRVARTDCKHGWYTGGDNGFSQAIELASDTLSNVKFVQEKRLISRFFDEISQDTGKVGFGVHDTLQLMEMGAVETLIVWEDLEVERCVLKNSATGEEAIKFMTKEQQAKADAFQCVISLV
jgi:peptide subunit release factor 1 (eRF1)